MYSHDRYFIHAFIDSTDLKMVESNSTKNKLSNIMFQLSVPTHNK